MKYDAVLLGASVGSMSAAISLAEKGLKPIIIEKSALVGGGTAYSGGLVWAPNNHRMRAKGIVDSEQEAMAYLRAISQNRWDPAVALAYVRELPRVLQSLEHATSLRWVTYTGLPDYYSDLPGGKENGRFLLPLGAELSNELENALPDRTEMGLVRRALHVPGAESDWTWGRALVGALWARVLELGVAYRLNHRATCLVNKQDGLTGVEVLAPSGTITVQSRLGVLLNTGGFEWNRAMTEQFMGPPLLHPQTPPSNEGDGHAMAARLGADMQLMDLTIGIPAVLIPGSENDGQNLYRVFFQPLCLPHSLVVNRGGHRFANETFFIDMAKAWEQTDSTNARANFPAFLIFDGQYRKRYGLPPGLQTGVTISEHPTLSALALHHGIDGAALNDEVAQFNRVALAGGKDRFGRGASSYQRAFGDAGNHPNPTLGPIDTPPFFAVELHPSTAGHRGGARIDAHARVLDRQGDWVPGLYACGNSAAGSVTGANYISGATIGHALVFGTLAAEDMASRAA